MIQNSYAEDSLPSVSKAPQTFAIETYAHRAYNYMDNMVDTKGSPYFDVFCTEPAEAAHDWPDFTDVTARQLQGAVMARHMTGKESRNEKVWKKLLLSYLNPETGIATRQKTSYCGESACDIDQALSLYAMVSVYSDKKDPEMLQHMQKMVDHMPSLYNSNSYRGFMLKSLMTCVRVTGYQPALEQAKTIIQSVFYDEPVFGPDNTIPDAAHGHSTMRLLVGAADYALYTKDPVIFSRVDALYRAIRAEGTRFGFVPEFIRRKGDIITCETCTLMDFVGVAATLANNGHPEYWGDIERMVRNHLVESQVSDLSWFVITNKPDTAEFTWRDVGARMIGGYAGWSSPTHMVGAYETLPWGGPAWQNKPRAFQNCCGGSGTHAFFIVWKNAARYDKGVLSVNLHIDKLLPQAEIRCYQPYKGLLTIKLKEACKVKVRIPEFVTGKEMVVKSSKGEVKPVVQGNCLVLGSHQADELLEISYPVPVHDEEITIGNPGFRQYRYRVTWKGDTVVRMFALGDHPKTGYSDFMKKQAVVYSGNEGPGPLYQREAMLQDASPQPAELHMDDGSLDFWWLR